LYRHLGSTDRQDQAKALVNFGAIDSVQRSHAARRAGEVSQGISRCRTRVVPALSSELFNSVDSGDIELAAVIRPPFTLQGISGGLRSLESRFASSFQDTSSKATGVSCCRISRSYAMTVQPLAGGRWTDS
jgi:hypothetical protein